ncbi:ABC transporter permease [Paractinoplanes lichenicola]|nr:ABC transporter permease [Actinoplanes lichenicola]
MVNGMRGRPSRVALFVLGAVMAGFFAIAGYALFAIPGVAGDERVAGLMLQLGGAALVVGWLLLPLIFFGVDESLDPARFALFPLRRRTLITGLFAAALAGLPALSTLAATAGMVNTVADLGGALAAMVQLVGILGGLLVCVAVSRAVTSAFATALRSRRSRDLAVVLFAVLAALLGPLQLALLAGAERADWNAFAVLADVLGWTPLAAPYAMGMDVVEGRLWAVPLRLLIVAATIAGLLRWWGATLESAMVGTEGGRRAGSNEEITSPTGLLLGRRLPRTRFGALVARESRYWWRETRRRAALITFTVAGLFLPLSLTVSGGPAGPMTVFVGAIAAIALANQFGYEGSAYAANLTAGVPGRVEIHSRATAHALFVLPLLLLVAVVVGAVSARPERIAGDLGLLLATYGVGLGFVLPMSVRAAYPLPESTSPFAVSSGGGMAKGLLTIAVMIGTLVATAPLQILAYTLGGVWLWIGLPAGAAFGCAGYLIGSAVAADWLDRRSPELLAAVTAS